MSSAPRLDRYSAAGEYERYRTKVLAMLERRFPRFDPDERLELYHAVWTTVLEKRRRGEGDEIESLEAYLMGGADKLAFKRIRSADARRRSTLDPLGEELSAVIDEHDSPEDRVVILDEARCVRSVIEALDVDERNVIKLRFDLGLDPHEVRARLGLRERQYRRLLERSCRKIVKRVADLNRGERSRRQISLLRACLSGVATERQRREAQSLLESDPKARALLRAMRRSANGVAAAAPLPIFVSGHEGIGAHVAELAAAAKQEFADGASAAKQHGAAAYVRASDPTPLVGARPGAVAATIAGCIAVGGGTYCAVQGIPEPLRSARVAAQSAKHAKKGPPKPEESAPIAAPAPPPVSQESQPVSEPGGIAPTRPPATQPTVGRPSDGSPGSGRPAPVPARAPANGPPEFGGP